MSRRRGAVPAALACLLLLGGCTDDRDTETATWATSDEPVDGDGLVWASGSEVHLPDGSTLDLGDLAGAYVVGGAGVWFASTEPGQLEGNELPELKVATADGVEGTGAHPGIGTLTTTSDGRWLAFIDRLDRGSGPAEAVVVDLTTGEEVVRSDEGVVPADTDGGEDWTDLYEDAPVSMLGVVDGTAYVSGLSDIIAHDLDTGDVRTIDLAGDELADADWFRKLHPEAPLANEDGSWSILPQGFSAPVTELESADGEKVTTSATDADEWFLGGWLDPTTAIGITPTSVDGRADWSSPALITCTVPDGRCAVVAGTEDGVNLPVDRPVGLPRERSLSPG